MSYKLTPLAHKSVGANRVYQGKFLRSSVIYLLLLLICLSLRQDIAGQDVPANELYEVSALMYSPDGTKIAVGGGFQDCAGDPIDPTDSSNYAIRIVDSGTGQTVDTLEGHICAVNSLSWDPSGVRLVSSAGDGSVRVWDVTTGQQTSVYGASGSDGEAEPFEGAEWTPDAEQVAVFQGQAIILLNPSTGEFITRVFDAQDRKRVTAFAWNPNGGMIAAGTLDNKVKIWDIVGGQFAQPLSTFSTPSEVISIAWSPDGSRVATGERDGIVRIYDVASGQLFRTLSGHTETISSVTWSPDGNFIASGSWDNSVRVWDIHTGHQTDVFNNLASVLAVDWSPDGTQLAYGGAGDGALNIVTPASTAPTPTPTPVPSGSG